MTLKRLPLGDRSFPQIIDENFLYADKTRYIYETLNGDSNCYFLSRPRRFGKTLLLSVFKELFSGRRERFKGLWIDQSDYDFPEVPVIHLSLNMDADTPEIVRNGLISKLRSIASLEDLKINADAPSLYFGSLIEALYKKKNNTPLAILIDEYDAPVTRMMDDEAIATKNAKILRDFFTVPKDYSDNIRFIFVTGITRYALNSTDSGPNYLTDISLDPKFAGICGFTLEEFDALFTDRLEGTLKSLKEKGAIDHSTSVDDLKAEIRRWYDGYNWGGDIRVLNPYSILHFFKNNIFDNYWIQSGQPGHLTAMVRARPQDFLAPSLESYSSAQIRKSKLVKLQAGPVLFHSGYLTIDEITYGQGNDSNAQKSGVYPDYSLRLPNYEVASSYYEECFEDPLDLKFSEELKTKKPDLLAAFSRRDAETCESVFSAFFRPISYHQRPKGEPTFQAFVQLILSAMRFEVGTEFKGAVGRLDLYVKLSSGVYLIIELKYCPNKLKLKPKEENMILASVAMEKLPKETVDMSLAAAARQRFKTAEIYQITSANPQKDLTKAEANRLLAQAAVTSLSEETINQVLAKTARDKLPEKEIEEIFQNATSQLASSQEEIDNDLTKAAQLALEAIYKKDYHGVLELKAQEIIDLGLAVYGHGERVKAIFAPKSPKKES